MKGARSLLLLIAVLALGGCRGAGVPADETAAPTATPTVWPTLAPVGSTTPAVAQEEQAAPRSPRLVEQYRVALEPGVVAVFPLEGHSDHPVRIEVLVLEGAPDPVVTIDNNRGDQLARADVGGPGEPEVIGQFQFPASAYYQLGITSATVGGAVGVSVYWLDPASLEGGGTFSMPEQELRGRITHPLTYHAFLLPAERGQRFDLAAVALTGSLDLLFELYGPDGRLLAARDDNVGNDPYLWNFMPAQSGLFTVILSNYGETTGDYLLRLSPSEGGGEAVIGSRTELPLQGTPRRSTWLTLEGRALDAISVSVTPLTTGVDPAIAIYDPFGNRLTVVDVSGRDQEEQLTLVQFPSGGQYQLEFTNMGDDGTVQYLIRRTSQLELDEGGAIAPGPTGRDGVINGPGTVYSYFFDGQAGDLVSIDAHPQGDSEVDLGFDVYTPDGYRLVSLDDVVGKNPVIDRLQLPQSGRCALTVWNFGDMRGEFIVFLTLAQAPAPLPSPSATPQPTPDE